MVEIIKQTRKVVFDEDEENIEKGLEIETPSDTQVKWESLHLKPKLMKGIYSVGFENPSFIQKKAVPIIEDGRDLRAQAQSGTGKTGAFVVGTLQKLDESLRKTQVLVLASTREIAAQNAKKYEEIGQYMGVTVCLLLGGTSTVEDAKALSTSPQVVVGTPGRVNSMILSQNLDTSYIKIFVLDEADEMLKAGFEEQVKSIFQSIVAETFQTLLFSATYSETDLEAIKSMVEDPAEIDLRYEDQTLKGIKQYYVDIGPSLARGYSMHLKDQEAILKAHTLIDIFKNQTLSQVMIFYNRKHHAGLVHKTLNENGFPCELISSEFTQEQRKVILENFKAGKTRVLVSSGLCKRGIDVQALSVVVCLDVPMPEEKNDFIHRVGRSGRYGRKGIALHILTTSEVEGLKKIAGHFHSVIDPLPNNFNFKD